MSKSQRKTVCCMKCPRNECVIWWNYFPCSVPWAFHLFEGGWFDWIAQVLRCMGKLEVMLLCGENSCTCSQSGCFYIPLWLISPLENQLGSCRQTQWEAALWPPLLCCLLTACILLESDLLQYSVEGPVVWAINVT